MEMDAPESLEDLRNRLKLHYSRFPRFTSRMVRDGSAGKFHLEQITDQKVLNSQFVRINDESLDFEAMQQLVA